MIRTCGIKVTKFQSIFFVQIFSITRGFCERADWVNRINGWNSGEIHVTIKLFRFIWCLQFCSRAFDCLTHFILVDFISDKISMFDFRANATKFAGIAMGEMQHWNVPDVLGYFTALVWNVVNWLLSETGIVSSAPNRMDSITRTSKTFWYFFTINLHWL